MAQMTDNEDRMKWLHLKQAGAIAAFADQLEREGEPRAAAMADQLAEFYRQWAAEPSVVPPTVEAPPIVAARVEGPQEGDLVRLTYGDGSTVEGTWRAVLELDDGTLHTHTRGHVRRDVLGPWDVRNCRCAELGADQREHVDGVCIPRYIVGS